MAKITVSLSSSASVAEEFRKLIPELLHVRTYAHVAHLNAKGVGSAAKHEALRDVYIHVSEHTDKLAEAGLGSLLKDLPYEERGFPLTAVSFPSGDEQSYFKAAASALRIKRALFDDYPELQALLDEITTVFDSAVYKLGLQ